MQHKTPLLQIPYWFVFGDFFACLALEYIIMPWGGWEAEVGEALARTWSGRKAVSQRGTTGTGMSSDSRPCQDRTWMQPLRTFSNSKRSISASSNNYIWIWQETRFHPDEESIRIPATTQKGQTIASDARHMPMRQSKTFFDCGIQCQKSPQICLCDCRTLGFVMRHSWSGAVVLLDSTVTWSR